MMLLMVCTTARVAFKSRFRIANLRQDNTTVRLENDVVGGAERKKLNVGS